MSSKLCILNFYADPEVSIRRFCVCLMREGLQARRTVAAAVIDAMCAVSAKALFERASPRPARYV